MGKLPYTNPHLNPNPNPNSIPKKKKLHELSAQINGRHADESPSVTQTASDDAYSFNQRPIESNNRFDFNHGGYISFNTGSYTRSELIQFKKRLVSDFERIRSLNDRIESGKFKPRSHGSSQLPIKSKKLSGNKRPIAIPSVSGNDSKRLCQTADNGIQNSNVNPNLMKMCRQALTKLMKHKNSWVFNKPVDAAAMGLHDYHQIIKRPMDLGTVKSNFAKNLYSSPVDFAADVRLTFNNAMLYNPKFDDVYVMAEQLLARFEELFRAINHKLQGDRKEKRNLDGELHGSSWNYHISTPEKVKKPKFKPNPNPNPNLMPPIANEPERMPPIRSGSSNPLPPNPPSAQSPVRSPPSPVKPLATRTSTAKQPKPKAKDLDKREMSMEEKQKLGIGLQSLPPEKMPQLVQIIRKRNEHLADESDEIELDIETLDKETLWELDRFVTNWKKMVSKNKRQALMVNNNDSATPTSYLAPRACPMGVSVCVMSISLFSSVQVVAL